MEKRLLVIQEHHTVRNNLHWDVRFESYNGETETYLDKRSEHSGEPRDTTDDAVLRSFVIPKHEFPLQKGKVRMAIPVDDHPWSYRNFEGEIKEGYGKGTVKLIFCDYVEVSTFTQDKVTFHYGDHWYTIFKASKGYLIKIND
jgi:hypothetical protein